MQCLGNNSDFSLGAFARDIMTASSKTLESVNLQLRQDSRNPVPDLPFPNLYSIRYGFLDDPANIQIQNFPNLENICLAWHLHSTDSWDLIDSLRAFLHKFSCCSASCNVLVFAYVNSHQICFAKEVKVFISSLPNNCNIALKSYFSDVP